MSKKKEVFLKLTVENKQLIKVTKLTTTVVSVTVVVILVAIGFFHSVFYQRIFPQVWVANTYLSGLTKTEALDHLIKNVSVPTEIKINYQNTDYLIDLSSIDFKYNLDASVDKAYKLGRNKEVAENIFLPLVFLFNKNNSGLSFTIEEEKLRNEISTIAEQINKESVKPSVSLINGNLVVEKGTPGEMLDENLLAKTIKVNLSENNHQTILATTVFDDTSLSEEEGLNLKERAQKILEKSLVLEFEDYTVTFSKNTLLALLRGKGGYENSEIENVVENFSSKIERDPQNPVFVFSDSVVKEFAPAKNGVKVSKDNFRDQIVSALAQLEDSEKKVVLVNPQVTESEPQYQTSEVNNLGIKELLGRGTSKFVGSISSRIHNIGLAASKLNGVLIAPGDTLSFNNILGDVSAATGYQQAYIIKEGATILGDGGGVCQVSTTFFRAALKAGLPIIERRAHAYRVGYYEQDSPPGFDATVYSPSPDLKIKNDTPAHLLIQTIFNSQAKTLAFEIYGTSDGRVSKTTKPTVSAVAAPPEDLYIDDPTLPTGQIKQIDWKAWGAKVSFKYTVTRSGETIYEKTFTSTYQPWQAKYLRGTGN